MRRPKQYSPAFAGLLLSAMLALCWPPAGQSRSMNKSPGREGAPSAADPGQPVALEKREEGDHRYLLASNRLPGPVEMQVELREAANMETDPALPYRIVLPPHSSAPIVALRLQDPGQDGGIRYAYGYTLGDPAARQREGYPYLPPIPPNSEYRITQGFFGRHSHQGEQNRYAVDIAMPEHTPVHAARGGVVMIVEKDVAGGGDDEEMRFHANHIRILHDDGTMAVYAHLAAGKSLVQPGDQVAAGQRIGYSGSSGYSSGPHLHFVIQHNAGMRLESQPFRFAVPDGGLWEPLDGAALRGFSRGRG